MYVHYRKCKHGERKRPKPTGPAEREKVAEALDQEGRYGKPGGSHRPPNVGPGLAPPPQDGDHDGVIDKDGYGLIVRDARKKKLKSKSTPVPDDGHSNGNSDRDGYGLNHRDAMMKKPKPAPVPNDGDGDGVPGRDGYGLIAERSSDAVNIPAVFQRSSCSDLDVHHVPCTNHVRCQNCQPDTCLRITVSRKRSFPTVDAICVCLSGGYYVANTRLDQKCCRNSKDSTDGTCICKYNGKCKYGELE